MEELAINNLVELEFNLNTSPGILYYRLSNPIGLSEWFADNVTLNGDIYSFWWNKSEHQAQVVASRANRFVRFEWLDEHNASPSGRYIEFTIAPHELTGEVTLHIVEQLTPHENPDDSVSLWNHQVGMLKRLLGG